MIPDTTLAEIEAAARAATEGPWAVAKQNARIIEGAPVDPHNGFHRLVADTFCGGLGDESEEANARFIALACNNAAAMVEEIRAARAVARRVKTDLGNIRYNLQQGSAVPDREEWLRMLAEIERAFPATQKGTSDV